MTQLAKPAPAGAESPRRRRLGRRQRQRLSRGVQYVLFIAVIVVVAYAADWGRLADAFFRLDIARGMFPGVVLIARDGQVVIRPMMYLALSYDHRVIDGATAVQYLVKVKQMIEDPETLLIEG